MNMSKIIPVWQAGSRWLLTAVAGALCTAAQAQQIESLAQVRSVFVAPFTGDPEAAHLHDSFVHRLARTRLKIANSREASDAVVHGSAQIWVRGHVSVNARTPSAERRAAYTGYLSIAVLTRDGEPLWSWLMTPGAFTWNNIVDDLATHAAKKLADAAEAAPTPASPQTGASGSIAPASLTAAGATFPAPLYQKWFEDFAGTHAGVAIHYSPVGSQMGIEKLAAGQLDFAGSDVVPEEVVGAEPASHLRRIASVLGGVVPIYNLNGIADDLHFTQQALADIYLGRIRRWNDPEIQRSNRGIDLPDAPIAVIHRSDGSGTTWVWSDFLSKSSPDWLSKAGRGTSIQWPVGTGFPGNEGVAEAVQNTPNSIGYVELTYAIHHRLSFGAVRNRAGQFLHADLDSLAEAARSAGGDAARSITDSPAKLAYPIAAFTWLVFSDAMADKARRDALNGLLHWVLTSGQKECSGLGYAPLPREIVDRELKELDGSH